MTGAADLAICIGRFAIPRNADFARLRHALSLAPRCLVFVSGAHRPPSLRHPFSWQQRAELLRDGLSADERSRIDIHPLRDGYGPTRMLAEIGAQLPAGAQVLLQGEGAGGFEPPPDWQLVPAPPVASAHDEPGEASLRDLLLASPQPADALSALQPHVPAHVLQFLGRWVGSPGHASLREEHQQIASEKAAWSVAPYPVVLVTVDAVVRAAGHVLLIRRGRSPGKGLRALPGGFLDPSETVRQAALRELAEETQVQVPAPDLAAALRAVQVFDDPERSQRGRVVTHAHYFDLGERDLPAVCGSDDAAAADWVPIAQLAALESQFLDDHFRILDHFLQVLPPAAAAD